MSEDVIVLGATVSLTGKHAQNGVNAKNGYDLAARELFTKGYRYALPRCRPPTNISRRPSTSPPSTLAMENDPFTQDGRAGVIDDIRRHGMQISSTINSRPS